MPTTPEPATAHPSARANAAEGHQLGAPDALSSVLSLVKLRGELICTSRFTAPFGVAFPPGPAHFHAVESGSVWVATTDGSASVHAGAGSFLLFPRGDGHLLADTPTTPTLALAEASRLGFDRPRHLFRTGGGGAETRMLCARFRYESALAPRFLASLPRLIHVRAEAGAPAGPLSLTGRALMDEMVRAQPGGSAMITRLLDLLFVQLLQAWTAEHPGQAGWLAGAADRRIGQVLAALHEAPGRPWSVDALARQAGMSRSAFADRFRALVGEAPASYLARWRLNLAADLLRGGREPVGVIAAQVGYRSEAAFSRAFKARFARAPRSFREQADGGAAAAQPMARPVAVPDSHAVRLEGTEQALRNELEKYELEP
jgi:AraC-like DNA-binding protein